MAMATLEYLVDQDNKDYSTDHDGMLDGKTVPAMECDSM